MEKPPAPPVRRGKPAGVLSVPLDQSGPVTFFANVELPQAGAWLDCELFVYSDRPDLQNMHNGVCFHLKGNDSGCAVVTPEAGVQNLGAWGTGSQLVAKSRFQFQLQYDPQRWRDSAVAERRAEPGRHAGGPVPVHRRPEDRAIRAVRREHAAGRLASPREPGLVPPRKALPAALDSVQVMLLNGDTISAKAVTFAEGKFTIVTDFGNIEPELKRVQLVRFPRRAAAPPAQQAEATVQTTEGDFTLRSCVLADDRLTGQSDLFGPVSLQRDALRSIRFRRGAP